MNITKNILKFGSGINFQYTDSFNQPEATCNYIYTIYTPDNFGIKVESYVTKDNNYLERIILIDDKRNEEPYITVSTEVGEDTMKTVNTPLYINIRTGNLFKMCNKSTKYYNMLGNIHKKNTLSNDIDENGCIPILLSCDITHENRYLLDFLTYSVYVYNYQEKILYKREKYRDDTVKIYIIYNVENSIGYSSAGNKKYIVHFSKIEDCADYNDPYETVSIPLTYNIIFGLGKLRYNQMISCPSQYYCDLNTGIFYKDINNKYVAIQRITEEYREIDPEKYDMYINNENELENMNKFLIGDRSIDEIVLSISCLYYLHVIDEKIIVYKNIDNIYNKISILTGCENYPIDEILITSNIIVSNYDSKPTGIVIICLTDGIIYRKLESGKYSKILL